MECPQCGYMLDAFTTECPRCARMKTMPQAAPATVSAPTVAPQQVAVAPAQSAAAPMTFTLGAKQAVALLASLMLALGTFTPVICLPLFGGLSLMHIANFMRVLIKQGAVMTVKIADIPNSSTTIFTLKNAGVIVIALAVLLLVTAFLRWSALTWIPALATFGGVGFLIGAYFHYLNKPSAALLAKLAEEGGEAVSKNASFTAIYTTMPLGWGAVLLAIGAILALTAAALKDTRTA